MFAGTTGSGVKDIPSSHSQTMPKKCITCHTYKEKADTPSQKGGHTFRVDEKVCLQCHENPAALKSEWQTKISPMVKQLKELLDGYSDKASKVYRAAKLNYDLVIADGETGVHNPRYAQALLQHSITSLTAESAWKQQTSAFPQRE